MTPTRPQLAQLIAAAGACVLFSCASPNSEKSEPRPRGSEPTPGAADRDDSAAHGEVLEHPAGIRVEIVEGFEGRIIDDSPKVPDEGLHEFLQLTDDEGCTLGKIIVLGDETFIDADERLEREREKHVSCPEPQERPLWSSVKLVEASDSHQILEGKRHSCYGDRYEWRIEAWYPGRGDRAMRAWLLRQKDPPPRCRDDATHENVRERALRILRSVEIIDDAWKAEPDVQLHWLAGGRRVLVDRELVYDVEDDRFHRLAEPAREDEFSPDGERVARFDRYEHTFRISAWDASPPEEATAIPQFFDWSELPDKVLLLSHGHWIDDRRLLVFQRTSSYPRIDCRIYHVGEKEWSEPAAGCPTSSLPRIDRVERGPGDLLAVYSSTAGRIRVDLLRYTPTSQVPVPLPSYKLGHVGYLYVRFGPRDDAIWLEAPCELENDRPCPTELQVPFHVYRWSADGGLAFVDDSVPYGARFDPAHDRYAWVYEGELCVGLPRSPDRHDCRPLPRRTPSSAAPHEILSRPLSLIPSSPR